MSSLDLPLVQGEPLWGAVEGPDLPPLRGTHHRDVAIVGAGIAGLVLALELRERGFAPVVLEAERVGAGSSAASTALLLWETDVDFRDLKERLDAERAARVWSGCLQALEDLEPSEAARAGEEPFERLRARLDRLYPGSAGAPESARWSGLFPNSLDSLPFVGPVPGLEDAEALLAFGGNGIVFALRGAQLLARAYAGEDVKEELSLYAYDRLPLAQRARLRIGQALE